MPEWLYENGIGEERAALISDGEILEARIEPECDTAKAGAIVQAKLTEFLPNRRAGKLALASGENALIEPLPKDISEGASILVEITREQIAENWGVKLARAKHRADAAAPRSAPRLREQIAQSPYPVRSLAAHEPDALEEAGWSELLEQAQSGVIRFPGGALRIALTPAMTVIDVDGALNPIELAIAGAKASAQAIRRLDIAGSIGIDLPTLESKADRQAAADAFDAALPAPFERTAVNGFGFLQIVRKRIRPSLMEWAQSQPLEWHIRALLRRAERCKGHGRRTITAHPAIIAPLRERSDWIATLQQRIGSDANFVEDSALGMNAAVVSAHKP